MVKHLNRFRACCKLIFALANIVALTVASNGIANDAVQSYNIKKLHSLKKIPSGGAKMPFFGKSSASEVIVSPVESVGHEEHLMGPITAITNVLADLCPHGMLPLAFGIAAGGGTGPLTAVITLLIFGALSWYSLISFGRAADVVLKDSHEESLSSVWVKVVPGGEKTSYIPDLFCALLTSGCCLFYSAFIGDLFGALASNLPLPEAMKTRSAVLLFLHAIPILPLCLLKDLSALQYSSLLGLGGIVYTVLFAGKRLLDKSYSPGGQFFDLMPSHLQPAAQISFPSKGGNFLFDMPLFHAGSGILTLMNMCCVAFACHYNAVKYFMELKDRRVSHYGKVMVGGLGGTALVFLSMMILGYATFGVNSQALLLNNYHESKDILATLARGFTGLAIISGYPLMFAGLKSSMFSITKLDKGNDIESENKRTLLSVAMISVIAIGACFVTEHELATVIGVVGSIFGSAVIYAIPSVVNTHLLKDGKGSEFFKGELLFNKLLMGFGWVFAILGTWITLKDAGAH